jgi:rhomboid protease GluP
MAPLYLVSGAFGNLLSVLVGWYSGSGAMTVGASGAISGIIAAAMVVGWRTTGWRGPLTQAMVRWLGFVLVFGVLSNLSGAHIANSAHLGGALAGGAIAAMWRRGYQYSSRATAAVLAACTGVLLGSVGLVVYHDRTDRFAVMDRAERAEFTGEALMEGRCGDAAEGLRATERLGRNADDVAPLRRQVEAICGHAPK